MAELKSYDFTQVAVIIGGVQVTGFAEGDDVVSVKMNEDAFKMTVGADGDSTRSKTNNKSGQISVKLMNTSDSNDVLNGFAAADLVRGGSGIVPILIKDNSGRSLHLAEKAWVKKVPDRSYGNGVGNCEWVFESGEIVSTVGGN